MTDRRSKTSRANLGEHIPEALDPDGALTVSVRLPRRTVAQIDAVAASCSVTRSEVIRSYVEFALRKAALG